ncbi:MAG: DUF6800 family protein [Pirellulaceae bacterium]
MSGTERRRELRRRRHRRKQIAKLSAKAEKAGPAEKQEIARKLRNLTPGADVLIERLNLRS